VVGQRRKEKIAALEVQASTTTHLLNHQIPPVEQQSIKAKTSTQSLSDPSSSTSDVVEEIDRSPSEYTSVFDFNQDTFNFNGIDDFSRKYPGPSSTSVLTREVSFPNLPTPIPSTPSLSGNDFPLSTDAALLPIPTMSTIHAFVAIANAFDLMSKLWDPTCLHVIPSLTPAIASLPANLHPIAAQLTIPHHPFIDLLPWPSVREKLICVLSMPSSFRPAVAQDDDSMVRLVQDLDDPQDGVGLRVHGNSTSWDADNELVEDAWEIGELFYENWWWCCDRKVVEASNRRRKERGLGRLKVIGC
jgi:hypothetical protein